MKNKTTLTDEQRKALNKLWHIYGNHGKKVTHCNHRFIQNFLEHGEDTREFYLSSTKNDLTKECIDEVDKILNL